MSGSDPGATSTTHVYPCEPAPTWPFTGTDFADGSTWSYQSGDVISASGGISCAATARTELAVLARP